MTASAHLTGGNRQSGKWKRVSPSRDEKWQPKKADRSAGKQQGQKQGREVQHTGKAIKPVNEFNISQKSDSRWCNQDE